MALVVALGVISHATMLQMHLDQILALLVAERDKLNRAIEVLQGPIRRRGRPPKNPAALLTALTSPAPDGRRGGMSSAARKAQSKRMKLYWQKRRKQAAKKKG